MVSACHNPLARCGTTRARSTPSPRVARRGEVPVRRAVDDTAVAVEARAVAGAVPALLGGVPGDGATGMRADGLSLVQHAFLVAVGGHLRQAAADDAALVRLNLGGRINLAARQPVGVVRKDVEVLVDEVR